MDGIKVLFLIFISIYIISWMTILIVRYLFNDYFARDTEKEINHTPGGISIVCKL